MIRLILAALFLTTAAHAETCKAPNVARVLLEMRKGDVVCHDEGLCWYKPSPDYSNWTTTICLTPAEHEAALERGR